MSAPDRRAGSRAAPLPENRAEQRATQAAGDRPPRSSATIGLGALLLLSSGALVLVLAEGDSAPVWMIVAWFLLAAALAVIVAALVPTGGRAPGIDEDAGEEARAEQSVPAGSMSDASRSAEPRTDASPSDAVARETRDVGTDDPGAGR